MSDHETLSKKHWWLVVGHVEGGGDVPLVFEAEDERSARAAFIKAVADMPEAEFLAEERDAALAGEETSLYITLVARARTAITITWQMPG
jgi:hypothetical protein